MKDLAKDSKGYFSLEVFKDVMRLGYTHHTAIICGELYLTLRYMKEKGVNLGNGTLSQPAIFRHMSLGRAGVADGKRRWRTQLVKMIGILETLGYLEQDEVVLKGFRQASYSEIDYHDDDDEAGKGIASSKIVSLGDKLTNDNNDSDHDQEQAIARQYNELVHSGQGLLSRDLRKFLSDMLKKMGLDKVLSAIKSFIADSYAKKHSYPQFLFIKKFVDYFNKGLQAKATSAAEPKSDDKTSNKSSHSNDLKRKQDRAWQEYVKDNSDLNLSDSDRSWHKYDRFTDSYYADRSIAPKSYLQKFDNLIDLIHKKIGALA